LGAAATSAHAGSEPVPVTKANWKLAQRFDPTYLSQYIYSSNVTPRWIGKTDRFWYSWKDSDGLKFYLVDAKAKKKSPLFDSADMAAKLSEALHRPYDTTNLPVNTIDFNEKGDAFKFSVEGIQFEYVLETKELKNLGRPKPGTDAAAGAVQGAQGGGGRFGGGGNWKNESPDKKAYVYAKDYNLYLVENKDGKEQDPVQLTKDGEKNYGFGSRDDQLKYNEFFMLNRLQGGQQGGQGTGRTERFPEKRIRANAIWSPDSKRFVIERNDSRKVDDLFVINSLSTPRPQVWTYKYEMPGEANITQEELWFYDRDKKELKKLDIGKYKDQRSYDVHWPNTSDKLRFVRRDRLQRNLELCEMDVATGGIKVLLNETVENAFLERQNVRYVKPGGDFLWWSERNGWGHYYLYSFDGKLKNAVTSGPFRADRIVEVDTDKNTLWFQAVGREPGENAYYRHMYRIGLDGKGIALLDPGDADHNSSLSPSKKYVADIFSRIDLAPKTVLRGDKGDVLIDLQEMDVSRLIGTGWRMPEPFKVKGADGVTDIYGDMWKPFDFDPNKKYPIIAHVYPGPQTESVTAQFTAQANNQRLAQLGFIVVQIGNRGGTPARSNAYHSYGYYNLRDYGLADKKAGIEQLAAKYPWMDIDRVGIYGHSGGGFMTAAAMLLPPYNEFFKAGVSSSGNHDNNIYNDNWSEQHHGLREVPVKDKDGKNTGETKLEIHVPTTWELAPNLKGKLLLVHGDMDDNVHPGNTTRLVNALIRANKRFDLMIMPGQQHGYGDMTGYFNNMLMEYFAEHLIGDSSRGGADMSEHRK
jgi:dipeptidyl-peptidase 4